MKTGVTHEDRSDALVENYVFVRRRRCESSGHTALGRATYVYIKVYKRAGAIYIRIYTGQVRVAKSSVQNTQERQTKDDAARPCRATVDQSDEQDGR